MGQTILITGANRGIGLALTAELLKGGHRVLAGTRNPEKAADLEKLLRADSTRRVREVARSVHAMAVAALRKTQGSNRARKGHEALLDVLKLDVTSDESVGEAATKVGGLTGRLDVLVNNAAVFPEEGDESIFEMKLEHFREAFETNVLGVIRMTRAFVPLLEKGSAPRIVNISSGAGSVTAKDDYGYYAYAASKAALNMVTRGLAAEFRPRGICVVAMTPGWVKTEMGGPNAPLTPEESARAIAKTITTLTMAKTSLFIERTGGEVKSGW